MNNADCIAVTELYGWTNAVINPIESGLINHTWKVHTHSGDFILQKINTGIFSNPEWIDENIRMIGNYLSVFAPGYVFTVPVKNLEGETLVMHHSMAYRAFAFQQDTHTISVVKKATEAEEAARQFGLFTSQLSGFNASRLHITLPDFHNLALRFRQFELAVRKNNSDRSAKAAETARILLSLKGIVDRYTAFISHPDAHIRVTHHDTKISNVLFSDAGKGVCVIDLDTVMPGYIFSDAGDMFRTYLPPVSEEEADMDKIYIRNDVFESIEKGYLSAMNSQLTSFELENFYLSGEILIYMQAIRFLTDYLENDRYYGKKYPDQNWVRAQNQLRLLELYQESIV